MTNTYLLVDEYCQDYIIDLTDSEAKYIHDTIQCMLFRLDLVGNTLSLYRYDEESCIDIDCSILKEVPSITYREYMGEQ